MRSLFYRGAKGAMMVFDLTRVDTFTRLQKWANEVKEAQNDEKEHEEAEILSGIPIVEALLDNFISKHAIPAKLKDAVQLSNR